MRVWDKAEGDRVAKKIILEIYYEFCHRQRSQEMWEAGFETIQKIGRKDEKDC